MLFYQRKDLIIATPKKGPVTPGRDMDVNHEGVAPCTLNFQPQTLNPNPRHVSLEGVAP